MGALSTPGANAIELRLCKKAVYCLLLYYFMENASYYILSVDGDCIAEGKSNEFDPRSKKKWAISLSPLEGAVKTVWYDQLKATTLGLSGDKRFGYRIGYSFRGKNWEIARKPGCESSVAPSLSACAIAWFSA
jgi:hypothetical protein